MNNNIKKYFDIKLILPLIVIAELIVTVFDVGGYFVSNFIYLCFINIGIIVYLYWKNKSIKFSYFTIMCVLLGFCYLISGAVNNLCFTHIQQVSIWFSLACFCLLLAQYSNEDKESIIILLTIVGIFVSTFGLLTYLNLFHVTKGIINNRLSFPLQYANASAILYGIFTILSVLKLKKFLKLFAFIPFLCLIFTKSWGGILSFCLIALIWFFYLFYKRKNIKKTYCILFILALFVISVICLIVCFYVSDTFVERLIQILDGCKLLMYNVMGIGPDMWPYKFWEIQTAQYAVNTIHCGYLKVALDGGIFALVIFVATIIMVFKSIIATHNIDFCKIACALLILLHSLFDFDFRFIIIWMFLFIMMDKNVRFKKPYSIITFFICILLSIFCCSSYLFLKNNIKLFFDSNIVLNDPRLREDFAKQYGYNLPGDSMTWDEAEVELNSLVNNNEIDEACDLLLVWANKHPYDVNLYNHINKFAYLYDVPTSFINEYNNLVDDFNERKSAPRSSWLHNQKTIVKVNKS